MKESTIYRIALITAAILATMGAFFLLGWRIFLGISLFITGDNLAKSAKEGRY